MEKWKTLMYNNETFNKYEISTCGKLRDKQTQTIYKTNIDNKGYERVTIYIGFENKKIKNKNILIHRAVACTFVPNSNNQKLVEHIDGNKLNNYVDNLKWCTHKEKALKTKINTTNIEGCNNINSTLNKEDIVFIRTHYIKNNKQYGTRALARKFNVDHTTISNIINYKTYKNI